MLHRNHLNQYMEMYNEVFKTLNKLSPLTDQTKIIRQNLYHKRITQDDGILESISMLKIFGEISNFQNFIPPSKRIYINMFHELIHNILEYEHYNGGRLGTFDELYRIGIKTIRERFPDNSDDDT